MVGADVHRQLDRLAADFDRIAVPEHGRYAATADAPSA